MRWRYWFGPFLCFSFACAVSGVFLSFFFFTWVIAHEGLLVSLLDASVVRGRSLCVCVCAHVNVCTRVCVCICVSVCTCGCVLMLAVCIFQDNKTLCVCVYTCECVCVCAHVYYMCALRFCWNLYFSIQQNISCVSLMLCTKVKVRIALHRYISLLRT